MFDETPKDLGLRLLRLLLSGDCPQDEALALIAAGAEVNMKNAFKNTALHRAAMHGHTAIVLALIGKGAGIKTQNDSGYTPLHLAAWSGHTDTVLVLIKKGAEIGVKDSSGNTALHRAAQDGHVDTVLALLENGAEIGIKNDAGDTPEAIARRQGHTALTDHIRAAQFERATKGFREGLEYATPALPCLQVPKRRSLAP